MEELILLEENDYNIMYICVEKNTGKYALNVL